MGRVALLQVREAARILGVHENTLRRWEQNGVLHAVKLPSGVRRFRPEDIEAIRERMYEGLERRDDRIAAALAVDRAADKELASS